MIYFSEAV